MNIEYRRKERQGWIVEVWDEYNIRQDATDKDTISTVYLEDMYTEINQWCIDNLGYHARTAYHIFELKKQSDLNWFLLRWQ